MKQVYKEMRLSVAMNIPDNDDELSQESWEFMLITQLLHRLEAIRNPQRSDFGYIDIEFEGWADGRE